MNIYLKSPRDSGSFKNYWTYLIHMFLNYDFKKFGSMCFTMSMILLLSMPARNLSLPFDLLKNLKYTGLTFGVIFMTCLLFLPLHRKKLWTRALVLKEEGFQFSSSEEVISFTKVSHIIKFPGNILSIFYMKNPKAKYFEGFDLYLNNSNEYERVFKIISEGIIPSEFNRESKLNIYLRVLLVTIVYFLVIAMSFLGSSWKTKSLPFSRIQEPQVAGLYIFCYIFVLIAILRRYKKTK